jgi:drug/metabolite transporter (DMT)-like permease
MRPAGSDRITSHARVGLVMAVLSAATFGSSGATAKSLITAGWTPGGIVLVRLSGAAVVLCLAATIRYRGRWPLRAGSARVLIVYGTIAMAGTQFAYFNAVRTLDVGVALLLEFLAPVLILVGTSVRARRLPSGPTLVGAGIAVAGLALVIDPRGATTLDPVGVAWGLVAALCLSGFFVLSAEGATDLPVLILAAGGTAVGALQMGLAGLSGLVPIAVSTAPALLAGREIVWWQPTLWLVAVATVFAYLTGIAAITRLGTRVASFVGLTEVLFAVLVAWLVLAELPSTLQLAGGTLIVAGIVVIQQREQREHPGTTRAATTRPRAPQQPNSGATLPAVGDELRGPR